MSTPILNPLADPILCDPRDTARLLGVSVDTLSEWRTRGYGPTYVRVGRGPRARVRYPYSGLVEWVAGLAAHRSTAEYDTSTAAPEPRQLDLRAMVMGQGAGI